MGGDEAGASGAENLHISIHAPRMGGDSKAQSNDFVRTISIHAPRMGGDDDLLDALQ
ncbi:hypothetical protein C816_03711, partial [Oscillibacter sp. 1-3]